MTLTEPSWRSRLLGDRPTRGEMVLALSMAAIAWVVALSAHLSVQSPPLTVLLATALAFDVAGGIAVNASEAGKRHYHRPSAPRWGPVVFAAGHVHPLLVALLVDQLSWVAAFATYAWCVLGSICVVLLPRHLRYPAGLGIASAGIAFLASLGVPALWFWLPVLLLLKLVVAHAPPK